MNSKREVIGEINGVEIQKYTISNDLGMEVELCELGGQCLAIRVPDKSGKIDDITLHYKSLNDIYENPYFFGAIVARNANRIDNAKFNIDGVDYELTNNDNGNNLHSGNDYFNKKIVLSSRELIDGGQYVEFSYIFKHMEQGYPGEADFKIRYTLNNRNELKITYSMICSRKTIFNPTAHIYWNLGGHKKGNIFDHELKLYASQFTPINEKLIPHGFQSVVDTPLDFFTKPKMMSEGIDDQNEQIRLAGGFDHNFVIDGYDGTSRLAAEVYEKTTGRKMQVFTDLPGIQFYSGNFIKDTYEGKEGARYDFRSGFCLETQYFPNAMNNYPEYQTPVIEANKYVKTTTTYAFS